MIKVGFIVLLFVFIALSMINYFRAKKMISLAPQSIFPLFHENWPKIYIFNGEVEKPTFQMKRWKVKRNYFILSILVTFLMLFFTLYFWKDATWPSLIIFILIPFNFLVHGKAPCFFVLEDGFYYVESFFPWEDIKAFSLAPVTLSSDGYGMFVDSTSYTEIRLYPASNDKSKPVYVQGSHAVEKMRHIFLEKGLEELSSSKDHLEQISGKQK